LRIVLRHWQINRRTICLVLHLLGMLGMLTELALLNMLA